LTIPLFIWGLSGEGFKILKFSFLMLKFKKYRVRRFTPSQVRVLNQLPHGERFFSRYGKNLSPCGKFNDIDSKNKQKSAIFTVRELAKDKLFILYYSMLVDLPHGEIFLPYIREKSLAVRENSI
jgi:hypothetical protein